MIKGDEVIHLLIKLLEDQERIKITYNLKENEEVMTP